jgi:hypothetical protein
MATLSGIITPTNVLTASNTVTLTNKTVSVDDNTVSGVAASSFVLSNGSGNIDGSAAQKVIPAGVVVGTTASALEWFSEALFFSPISMVMISFIVCLF